MSLISRQVAIQVKNVKRFYVAEVNYKWIQLSSLLQVQTRPVSTGELGVLVR